MPKADLSGAQAKLEWAHAQTNILNVEFRVFFERKPYRLIAEPDPQRQGNIIKLQVTEAFPASCQVTAGMIIAAQHDSLDLLAHALAEKNGAVEPRDVYFPICESEAGMTDPRTLRKIRRLAPEDRAIIVGLKPYKGGNDLLYALHTLNNKAKHRKLVAIGGVPAGAGIGGHGHMRSVAIFGMKDGLKHGAEIAFMDADPGIQLSISLDVAFHEVGHTANKPVIETLREFSRLSNEIINLFG